MARTKNYKDLTGLKIGRWTVIKPAKTIIKANKPCLTWECICECGVVKIVLARNLNRGDSKSCGCLKKFVDKTREMLPFGEAVCNWLFDNIQRRAKKKGNEFTLTKDEFKNISEKDCIYCGQSPKEYHLPNANGYYLCNGIDRIDNKVGYIFSNCAPCCENCNLMKRTHTVDEWMAHMIRIFEHYKHGEPIIKDLLKAQ